MPVAMITAAVAAAGAVLGNMRANSAATAELEQYGRERAAITMDAAIQQQNLVGQVASSTAVHQNQTIAVEQERMRLEAESSVSSAAAGVKGSSVELSLVEVDASAGRKQGSISVALDNTLSQLDQASRDIELQKESGIAELIPFDKSGQLANVFLQGLQGFVGAGGFGE